jgi:UDP-3-O-[3-hydroxymyristoyl] glucosamine N-acyltransferase
MASGLTIEKGTIILGQTGVNKSLKKGTYFGPLAQEFKEYLRNEVKLKKMK